MISVRNLTRKYGTTVAVDDVTIEIAKGEIVGLLGHNGAGKTTIMKVLTGYLEPTIGTVTVGGADVVDDRLGVQSQIGYLPENAPLYPDMLVQEYLLMMAELRGIPADQRIAAVGRAVVATGLQDRLTQPIRELSKGFRQRVGLAQAIVHEPEVLILDEPTNGLDPTQILSIRSLIRRLAENATVILSTHILQEIEAVCDRVLVLIGGRLAADSTMAELLVSDEVRLSVAAGTKVAAVAKAIDGVRSVERIGEDPAADGYELWTLVIDTEKNPVPALVEAGAKAGWSMAAVAREQKSLQRVFNDLQIAHAGGDA